MARGPVELEGRMLLKLSCEIPMELLTSSATTEEIIARSMPELRETLLRVVNAERVRLSVNR